MNIITRQLTAQPIAGALGAEIHGTGPLAQASDALIAEIRDLWLEHSVIFFRDQPLEPKDFVAFARRFGDVVHYPFLKGLEEAPEVITVAKREDERVNFGGLWHTDTAYLEQPPMATILVAREIPPYGGDTLFASGYAAYEALSDGMKRMLEPLRAVNSSAKAEKTRTREDRKAGEERKVLEASHPVVRTHPETGRKALYVNGGHTLRFEGMSEEESTGLLEFLFQHQVRPEFTCRFRWEPGSIAFWDNRCALHNPVNDYHGFRRIMHRVTLAGDRPA
ncbi:TauD/TfdA dioxygenase family protein [Pararoseomonas indoligenes]|uniref:TauD/TfdA family dioxygenase n=1 Tax=Roseomonas indoligenes TaxID=2820811 RepID=A0A940N3G4_9PROT|nr:TauD/TfdA family dioxygenase [Pararoseomonas indoligenes]MBP0496065.1 TauD/TfdA family dioxygenase [Pararoseomonas indoligenes]